MNILELKLKKMAKYKVIHESKMGGESKVIEMIIEATHFTHVNRCLVLFNGKETVASFPRPVMAFKVEE